MKFVQSFTNVRPVKNDAPELIFTSTKGTAKLTPSAAALMGLGDGDLITICNVDFEDGSGVKSYITQGTDFTKEAIGSVGQKLSAINGKAGGYLQFSSRNSYAAFVKNAGVTLVDGKATKNVHFKVVGAGEGEEELVKEAEGQKFYPIEFARTTEIIVQTKGEKGKPASGEAVNLSDEMPDDEL